MSMDEVKSSRNSKIAHESLQSRRGQVHLDQVKEMTEKKEMMKEPMRKEGAGNLC